MSEPSLVGTTLEGAYRIARLIAKGGMSTVYEAEQIRLSQRVAVKVMARELASNEEALARFRREAEVTARLRHPHLVTMTDFGTAPTGQPYLVMEYLEGIDLDRRIHQSGRLPLPAVVSITTQAAAALTAAHAQGIVHRDLKPANVFLVELADEPEFVKILDFGISKVRAATSQLTKASIVLGTPYYMSPEQATGMLDDIDHRTDQWALACIAWEMLSGRPPFGGDEMSAVFYQIIHIEPQALGRHAPGLPAAVEAVLRRALSKSIPDRFPSIRDFARALESAAASRPAEAPVQKSNEVSGTSATEGIIPDEQRPTLADRRADAPATREEALEAALQATVARKLKPIYAVAAVCVGLMLIAVLRSASPAKPVAPPPTGVDPGPAAPSPRPVTPVVVPLPGAIPAPSSGDAAATGTPVRASKPRPTPRKSPAAGKSANPFADPFAPPPQSDNRPSANAERPVTQARAAEKPEADFTNPFEP